MMIEAVSVRVAASLWSCGVGVRGSLKYIANVPTSLLPDVSTGNDQQPRKLYCCTNHNHGFQRGSSSTSGVMTGFPVAAAKSHGSGSESILKPQTCFA